MQGKRMSYATPFLRSCQYNTSLMKVDESQKIFSVAVGSWASADFFPGEGKIFQGGGQNILFA